MSGYASGTTVSATKTQGEIMGLLGSRGVVKIATMHEPRLFSLAFEYNSVGYRIALVLPDPSDPRFTQYMRGSVLFERTDAEKAKRYEDEVNRKWRAFGMVIKSKIVAMEEGISTMEKEFIGDVILAGGRTLSETYSKELPSLAKSGQVSALALPGGGR